jgi:hypothetical protein
MRPWVLLSLLSAVALGCLILFGNTVTVVSTSIVVGAGSKEDLLPLTTNLSDIDRIEIESIESNPNGQVTKVLASKTLTGVETDSFAKIWRTQNYVFGEYAMCHQPGYRLRFYRWGSLYATATVCFTCENINFNENCGVQFRAKTDAGRKLRAYLSNLFPGHDPDASKP